ncbi:phage antirepressor N-terminal domain-containing protein [Mucilaginibacter sp.]|uniref:phage antirepressor N-terminal domain-containing protein n=1 Tax=Mucilaginibacter sp. TaxID=1882438 RepID=UPI0026355E6E|nr:phage antirepressor N-terminal domain-containing protein [Mucilaginibacter sp.]MDB4919860.1 putative antirepressor protein [Mucilaginibacter sp.]
MPKYNKNQTSAALTLRNNLESQLDSYIEDQHCANETATAVISLLVDGQWWVAIKPICEALNVHYKHQAESIKEDVILGQLSRSQGMVAADGRLRNMTCLPEKYIYGWLFSIQSDSTGLIEYKKECYDILYDHFHGGIREKKISEKLDRTAQIEILNKKIEGKLSLDVDYIKVKELEAENIRIGKEIAMLEKEDQSIQLNMFREKYQEN